MSITTIPATYRTRLAARNYERLKESIRVAGLAIHAEGSKVSQATLRARGVTGGAASISRAISELLRDGSLPEECRHVRKAATQSMITPAEVRAMNERPPEPVAEQAERSEAWAFARKLYWTRKRKAWYRRANP